MSCQDSQVKRSSGRTSRRREFTVQEILQGRPPEELTDSEIDGLRPGEREAIFEYDIDYQRKKAREAAHLAPPTPRTSQMPKDQEVPAAWPRNSRPSAPSEDGLSNVPTESIPADMDQLPKEKLVGQVWRVLERCRDNPDYFKQLCEFTCDLNPDKVNLLKVFVKLQSERHREFPLHPAR
ncbi:hypothetical protein NW762_012883 [Fusarium torreyae]|uniref:Uncharacterized protein n=1 Tax=Fusarium torreyae TaxID=1237075 RepID=A0A9W8RNC7_9HYPO|nr:hypothetical protein NW762_012883 [Fusarium torreyae]